MYIEMYCVQRINTFSYIAKCNRIRKGFFFFLKELNIFHLVKLKSSNIWILTVYVTLVTSQCENAPWFPPSPTFFLGTSKTQRKVIAGASLSLYVHKNDF